MRTFIATLLATVTVAQSSSSSTTTCTDANWLAKQAAKTATITAFSTWAKDSSQPKPTDLASQTFQIANSPADTTKSSFSANLVWNYSPTGEFGHRSISWSVAGGADSNWSAGNMFTAVFQITKTQNVDRINKDLPSAADLEKMASKAMDMMSSAFNSVMSVFDPCKEPTVPDTPKWALAQSAQLQKDPVVAGHLWQWVVPAADANDQQLKIDKYWTSGDAFASSDNPYVAATKLSSAYDWYWKGDSNKAARIYAAKSFNYTVVDTDQIDSGELDLQPYFDTKVQGWLGFNSTNSTVYWEQKGSSVALSAFAGAATLAASAVAVTAVLAMF